MVDDLIVEALEADPVAFAMALSTTLSAVMEEYATTMGVPVATLLEGLGLRTAEGSGE